MSYSSHDFEYFPNYDKLDYPNLIF